MQAAALPPPSAPTLSTYVNLVSVVVFLAFAAYSIIRAFRKPTAGTDPNANDLGEHITGGLAAAQLPSAALLLYAAFDPTVLAQLSGLNIGLAVAGVVLGWVSIKSMLK
jgi:hypothetical protein